MSSSSSKILVEILCDNPRSRNTIEFAIQRHGKGRMDLGQSVHSHLVVVDYEGGNSREDLRRYHKRYPQRPVVLMLPTTFSRDMLGEDLADLDIEVVIKPLKVDDLIQAIEKCAARAKQEPTRTRQEPAKAAQSGAATSADDEATLPLPGGFLGTAVDIAVEASRTVAPRTTTAYMRVSGRSATEGRTGVPGPGSDIDLADPAAVDKARFRANDLLLGRLKNALRQIGDSDAVFLAEVDGRPLFHLLPNVSRVVVQVEQQTLAQMALQAIPEGQFTLRPDSAQLAIPEGSATMSVDALLWRLALLTYRGMIPEDTDPQVPVYLARWPNMTRLDPVPDSLRIAALWGRMPVDLARTARTLSVPQKHVFMFYAAAMTIGLVGPERRASNYLFKPDSPNSVAPRALLTHLAEYLSHGSGPSAEGQT